jgi:hypothetical protein
VTALAPVVVPVTVPPSAGNGIGSLQVPDGSVVDVVFGAGAVVVVLVELVVVGAGAVLVEVLLVDVLLVVLVVVGARLVLVDVVGVPVVDVLVLVEVVVVGACVVLVVDVVDVVVVVVGPGAASARRFWAWIEPRPVTRSKPGPAA